MEEIKAQAPVVKDNWRSATMLAPVEVQKMLALKALGWGSKRISRELGCSRNTVREYLRRGEWRPMDVSSRGGALEPHREWLAERLRQHRGNADVVRQDLLRELGVAVSLRTVQRAVEPLRRELRAQAVATVRYETAPGQQLQIDFGSTAVAIGDEVRRVHLFVATLGYSRRCYAVAFLHERQSAWLQGLEGAFRHFGGVPHEVLVDNAKALVDEHNAQTREVKFNDRFHAFCRYWGVQPRACAPYRARTKGKDERGVGYVKRNAIAGHGFDSVEALQAHLQRWMREVADVRVHGTTGEPPMQRFERSESAALKPLAARAPFLQVRELSRRVHTDACIELDTNRYSVPWKLIGEAVTVVVCEREVRVLYAGEQVACHAQSPLRRVSVIERSHLAGIVGAQFSGMSWLPRTPAPPPEPETPAELLRPLEQYEAMLGGGW
jgi:transposase